MSAAQGSKVNKEKGKKSSRSRRVREERADAFRRGVSAVLGLVLVLIFGFVLYVTWVFLDRPGFPKQPTGRSTQCLELYFYDTAVTYLVPVHRNVTLPRNENCTARAVQEFAAGPRDPRLARVYPSVAAPTVTVRDKVAILDLPQEIFSRLGGTTRERALLDALTLTVAAAGECSSARILIGGQPVGTTPEGYDLSGPLLPPPFYNLVPDTSLKGDSQWVTSYFLDSTGNYMVPLSIEVDSGLEGPREAVARLFRNPPQLSYPPPLPVCPPGYSLEPLRIENGVATVDISVPDTSLAFLDFDINVLRTALLLTLRDCCQVRDIALKLNGRDLESYNRFGELAPLPQNDCWNLERVMEQTAPSDASAAEVDL